MSRFGTGIIGCGNISATYLRLIPMFRGIEVRGIADINHEIAVARGVEFGVPTKSVDDLLSSPEIDIVVNLTVPTAHYAVTKDILAAGKHAYSEKPVALTLAEAQSLCDLAQESGLRIGSAPDTFLGAVHQQARALIDGGALGEVISGTAHVMNHGMEHWHPNPDFFFEPGGGPMLDIGPYYVSNLIQLLGPVRRVAALSSTARSTRQITSEPRRGEFITVKTPTTIHALFEFACGASVTLSTSWDVRAHRHGHMELYGTEGSLFLPDPNFFGGALELATGSNDPEPVQPWPHPLGQTNDHARANYRAAGLADMAQAIQENRPHRCSMGFALHTLNVMTAALRSGESGEFIDLTTTCNRPDPLGPQAALALLNP